jgi:hypothetical protein
MVKRQRSTRRGRPERFTDSDLAHIQYIGWLLFYQTRWLLPPLAPFLPLHHVPAPGNLSFFKCAPTQHLQPTATLKCRRDTGSASAPGAAHSLQPNYLLIE